ncbi:MAG TPA: hypothetical protein VMS98_00970 [Thermoanaerobaculia bacterium]|nr:hypothetical protein [Thermoanaerobaculia bacterium]
MAKRTATILGVVFLVAGVGGFIMPGMLGFHLSPVHSIIHLVSGALSLFFGLKGTLAATRIFSFVFGTVYALLGMVGFAVGGAAVPSDGVPGPADLRLFKAIPGVLELGTIDHLFHIFIGLLYVASALATRVDVLKRPGPDGTRRGSGL